MISLYLQSINISHSKNTLIALQSHASGAQKNNKFTANTTMLKQLSIAAMCIGSTMVSGLKLYDWDNLLTKINAIEIPKKTAYKNFYHAKKAFIKQLNDEAEGMADEDWCDDDHDCDDPK